MFLSLNAGELAGIIGAAATALTVFIIPTIKFFKKRALEAQQEKIERDNTRKAIQDIAEQISYMQEESDQLNEKFDVFLEDYDSFTTQNFKYMINDAYFGYTNIHEIPDDVLANACECCEIYVNKKHKNHEIRPRCFILWEEQERRAVTRGVHNE